MFHISAENANKNWNNQLMLKSIDTRIYYIKAIDKYPKNVSIKKINKSLNQNQSETSVLAGILKIKMNARVMLTVNIGFQSELVNEQLGAVMHTAKNSRDISKIYLKLDDTRRGVKAMNANIFGK